MAGGRVAIVVLRWMAQSTVAAASSLSTMHQEGLCDECGSPFFRDASPMAGLCAECAHQIYGLPPCNHVFSEAEGARRCQKWATSDYLRHQPRPDS